VRKPQIREMVFTPPEVLRPWKSSKDAMMVAEEKKT